MDENNLTLKELSNEFNCALDPIKGYQLTAVEHWKKGRFPPDPARLALAAIFSKGWFREFCLSALDILSPGARAKIEKVRFVE